MSNEPRLFGSIGAENEKIAREEGGRIYKELEAKFYGNTNKDFDLMFNSISCALFYFISAHVAKDNFPIALQLVHQNLRVNLDHENYSDITEGHSNIKMEPTSER